MAGQNLEEKVKTKEILTRDIVKNFSLFAAIASDPNENIRIGGDEIGVYGIKVLNSILKNVGDEAKAYLEPVFSGMLADYEQNNEFSPSSKKIFRFYSNLYNSHIERARAIDFVKLAGEYGLKQDDAAKHLRTNSSIAELIEKYGKQLKENEGKKNAGEFEANGVLKSIEYIDEYLKNNAKGKIWNDTVGDYIRSFKDNAENPGKYAKAEAEKRNAEILKLKDKLQKLANKG